MKKICRFPYLDVRFCVGKNAESCCPGGTLQSLLLDREKLLEEEPMGDFYPLKKRKTQKSRAKAVPFFLKVILQGMQISIESMQTSILPYTGKEAS